MKLISITAGIAAALAVAGPVVVPASAQPARAMQALARLEPGIWDIREIGSAHPTTRSMCIGDPTVLIQLQHGQTACSHFVVVNTPGEATVHYTCPINGYGRTTLKVETPRLVRIDTQGMVGSTPFAYRAEARRTGPCAGRPQTASR